MGRILPKKDFVLRVTEFGGIKIEENTDGKAIYFSTPHGDGVWFRGLLHGLKNNDEIIIKLRVKK